VTVLVDSGVLMKLFRGRNGEIANRREALVGPTDKCLIHLSRPPGLDGIAGRKAGDSLSEFRKSHSVMSPRP
jgi:hypothetical protein